MALKWDDIKDALTRNDTEKIAEYKQSLAKHMDDKAIQSYLSRHSIQSIVAASWGDVLLALQSDCNNLVAKFKLELLTEFASKHGLTAYTDASLIQPGDTVVTTWKHKKKTNISHFRILGRGRISMARLIVYVGTRCVSIRGSRKKRDNQQQKFSGWRPSAITADNAQTT